MTTYRCFFLMTKIEGAFAKSMYNFWQGLFQVTMKITDWVMKFAPIGVFGLVAKVVASTGFSAFVPQAWFFISVLVALSLHFPLVLPLGATVNMDGTVLYECVAAMFIAQAHGIELGFVQQFLIVMLALVTSIGQFGRHCHYSDGDWITRGSDRLDPGRRSGAGHVPHLGQCIQRFMRCGHYRAGYG